MLGRLASGESVADVARSFGVSRSFFSRVLHADRERHGLVIEARRRAAGDALLAEAVAMIAGAPRLRRELGPRAAALDRATLGTVDRLRSALTDGGGGEETSAGGVAAVPGLPLEGFTPPDFGRLHLEALRAPLPRSR